MPALRCPSCNRFRAAEEFEPEHADLDNISISGDGEIYASLSATVNIYCPECGECIGLLEVQDIEVKLGSKAAIEPA